MSVERVCLRERIRRAIIQKIAAGRWKPGDRLVETALAQEFETSPTPVREALHDLEAMRVLESQPYRGMRVREVSEQEMAEAYAVRGALEEYAAITAADRLDGEASILRGLAAGIQEAASRGDSSIYADRDLEFHRAIVAASGNATLLRLWESLAFEFRTPLMMARHPPDLATTAADHGPIVDALEAGDGRGAGRLLRRHAESFIPKSVRDRFP